MTSFQRPVGAQADAKEMEYIAALHQSGPTLRPNGSIRDEDIKCYLRSRFGMEVTLEDVQSSILQGLVGGRRAKEEEGEVMMDMMELVAILLIPLLVKAATLETGKMETLPEGVMSPPKDLLQSVLQIMLYDATGKHTTATELTPTLIKRMLLVHGEHRMADDDELIQEMLKAAGGGAAPFDSKAFAQALTKDVSMYDIHNEVRISTLIQDVFEDHDENKSADDGADTRSDHETELAADADDDEMALQMSSTRDIDSINHIYTAPAIDTYAGTYRSKALVIVLWACVLFGLFIDAVRFQQGRTNITCDDSASYDATGGWSENSTAIFCNLTSSILAWIVSFVAYSFFGVVLMGIGSLGNRVGNKNKYFPVVASFVIALFGYVDVIQRDLPPELQFVKVLAGIFTAFVIYFHMCHLIALCFPKIDVEQSKWARRLGMAALGNEVHIKKSGSYKLHQFVEHAKSILDTSTTTSVFKTYFGHGLSSYATHGLKREKTGGVAWLFHRVRDQSIFEKEGIWYSTRLVASNICQCLISPFLLIFGINALHRVIQNYDRELAQTRINQFVSNLMDTKVAEETTYRNTIDTTHAFSSFLGQMSDSGAVDINCEHVDTTNVIDELCDVDGSGFYNCSESDALCALLQNPDLASSEPRAQLALLSSAGFDVDGLHQFSQMQLETAVSDATEAMYPEELYMLTIPLIVAIIFAVFAAIRLSVVYIPGVTTTILKLRTGVIPSLGDPAFEKYRVAPDTATLLTGSLFWGCLVSSLLIGTLTGGLIFLLLWQGSVYVVIRVVVTVTGMLAVVLFRVCVTTCLRTRYYNGLYRTRPAAANISMLALEWAHFLITIAFISVRMFKLLFITVASIGQIDRPFLAEGVGQIGALEFDPFPTIHLRDIVAHEAHRHPYIEILGSIYLMKLRYSSAFANRAGSSWRLLFVYALFPWFHQHRIHDGDDKILTGKKIDEVSDNRRQRKSRRESSILPVSLGSSVRSIGSSQRERDLEVENARLKRLIEILHKEEDEKPEESRRPSQSDCAAA